MTRTVDIVLSPAAAADPEQVREAAEGAVGWKSGEAIGLRVLKRSIDARAREPRVQLRVEVSKGPLSHHEIAPPDLPDVSKRPVVVIVGAGPAGLFAALRSIALN